MGYKKEDKKVVGYETHVSKTNNEYQYPVIGFLYSVQFSNWGALFQSWYWEINGFDSQNNMPVSEFVQHALIARNLGAQIIMFEPYWYFFHNNGTAKDSMHAVGEII